MSRVVTMGRGGTGKTSFVAMMTKFLVENGSTPLLLVDVDPDQNLAEMVGVELEESGKKTISELVVETFLEEGGTTVGIPPTDRIESRIWSRGLYEGDDFDVIAVGTKWIEGCYCMPDSALKGALESLTKNYAHVLIDSPAGLEHLNRRISPRINDVFDIIDPSKKSFKHVERAYRVAKEVDIVFDNFYVVGGFRFPEELQNHVWKAEKVKFLGKIAFDERVEQFVLSGQSLLDLPPDSPGYTSVSEIMKKAGYSEV